MWLKSRWFTEWNTTKKVSIQAMYVKKNRNHKKDNPESSIHSSVHLAVHPIGNAGMGDKAKATGVI